MAWAIKLLRAMFPAAFSSVAMNAVCLADVVLLDGHSILRTLCGNKFTKNNAPDTVARQFCSRARHLIKLARGRVLVVTVDGVCPLAKRPTQRIRRQDTSLCMPDLDDDLLKVSTCLREVLHECSVCGSDRPLGLLVACDLFPQAYHSGMELTVGCDFLVDCEAQLHAALQELCAEFGVTLVFLSSAVCAMGSGCSDLSCRRIRCVTHSPCFTDSR